jgi:hypothetical protein
VLAQYVWVFPGVDSTFAIWAGWRTHQPKVGACFARACLRGCGRSGLGIGLSSFPNSIKDALPARYCICRIWGDLGGTNTNLSLFSST